MNTNRLTSQQREDFFAAQARHRRAAQRWGYAASVIVALLVLVIALLLAPLAIVAIGLLLDLVNLVVPMPNLFGAFVINDAPLDEAARAIAPARMAALLALVSVPGWGLLALAWWRLRQIATTHQRTTLRQALGLREPRADDREETQLRNVLEEMAIAAGRPPPTLYLLDQEHCNLGLIGDGGDAIVFVTRGVLDQLNRDQTQALVAQAVAALGNGDGRMGERMLRLIEMTGLLMLLSQAPTSASARRLLKPFFGLRGSRGDEEDIASLRRVLGDPWSVDEDERARSNGGTLTWRDWLLIPLMGSVIVGVIIVPITVTFLLVPLLGLAWRRRRLLADAAAVQFTRNPQGLAEAYAALNGLSTRLQLKAPWLVNVFALNAMDHDPIGVISPYPSLPARMKRLNAQGANVPVPPKREIPFWGWLLICFVFVPLLALVAALLVVVVALGVFVSLALNSLFLLPVAALLHALLR